MQSDNATIRFTSLARLGGHDIAALRQMAGPISLTRAGTILQMANEPVRDPVLLLDGWALSSVVLKGGGRQIVKVHMPGDLIGLTSLAFTRCVDTVMALTDLQVCTVPQMEIGQLFQSNARLAALLFLISLEERVVLVDRLVMIGRAETSQRIAALILQLRERLTRSNPAIGLSFPLPLTQAHVADMVGATAVHVSRVVLELGAQKLLKWERGKITILDLESLEQFAGLPCREMVKDPKWLPAP
jgi:CRP/FNR family transcriptional regulator